MVNKIVDLLNSEDFTPIFRYADEITKEQFGNIINIRGIIEFSNYCSRQCVYCGLNARNRRADRYRMSVDEIVKTAIEGYNVGYKTVVLQSGEDPFYTMEIIGDIIKGIKNAVPMSITLSIGERPFNELKYFRELGAERYLLKHETADASIYASLHPDSTLANRILCLKNIKKLGYETGSGFMIGLPNQTVETVANDILLLKELGCHMAGIGPFIPHPHTPLKDAKSGSTELTKRAVAVTRILMPHINLPATTSLGVINQAEKNHIFSCGANVIMRKLTPVEYREAYEIYPSKMSLGNVGTERKELEEFIEKLGKKGI